MFCDFCPQFVGEGSAKCQGCHRAMCKACHGTSGVLHQVPVDVGDRETLIYRLAYLQGNFTCPECRHRRAFGQVEDYRSKSPWPDDPINWVAAVTDADFNAEVPDVPDGYDLISGWITFALIHSVPTVDAEEILFNGTPGTPQPQRAITGWIVAAGADKHAYNSYGWDSGWEDTICGIIIPPSGNPWLWHPVDHYGGNYHVRTQTTYTEGRWESGAPGTTKHETYRLRPAGFLKAIKELSAP